MLHSRLMKVILPLAVELAIADVVGLKTQTSAYAGIRTPPLWQTSPNPGEVRVQSGSKVRTPRPLHMLVPTHPYAQVRVACHWPPEAYPGSSFQTKCW